MPRQWLGGAARVISTPLSIAAIMCAGKTDLSTYCQSYSIVGKILKYGNVFVTLCSNIKYEIAHIPHLQLGSSRVLHTFYISVHQLGNWPRHLRRPPVTVHTLQHCGFQLSVVNCSQATLLVKWNVAQKSEPACKARVYEWWKLVHSFLV